MDKENPNRKYINCPRCSVTLLQIEAAKNGYIKCGTCKQFVAFDVEGGKITVQIVPSRQDFSS